LIIDRDRTFPSDSPVCAYWLTRCEGFTVRSGRRELGVVESVAGGPLGLAETLQVHSRYRQRLLDAGQVTAVVPGRRLLIAEPAPARVRPVAKSAARTGGHALVFVSAQLVRLVAFLVPRVVTGLRVFASTAGRLIREEGIPRVRAGLTVLIDEVERLTLLDGEAQPERDQHRSGQPIERATHASAPQQVTRPGDSQGIAGQPQQRQRAKTQAERRERRNRARELRQQAREEEEHLRVAEVAEQALP
jgi:hypothetical protein